MASSKTIFLSHIHEEADLALLIKDAIEDEFSGFVDVFVSSDGQSIPVGAAFLSRIESALLRCEAAVYLLSPASVNRNWINFELGAVWIRDKVATQNSLPTIPTLPFCHSGLRPSAMPSPLNALNGIVATAPKEIERAFFSLQAAVGGRGRLKTDFKALASAVLDFQNKYTIGDSLKKILSHLGGDQEALFAGLRGKSGVATIELGFRATEVLSMLEEAEGSTLNGVISVTSKNPATMHKGDRPPVSGAELTIAIPVDILLRHEKTIRSSA